MSSIPIYVSQDTSSVATGADRVAKELLSSGCEVIRTGSRGAFFLEPMIEVEKDGQRIGYGNVAGSDVKYLLEQGE